MAGKFERRQFSEINLNDPFFDSLKTDYPALHQALVLCNGSRQKPPMGNGR
jgi:hypothetical protein